MQRITQKQVIFWDWNGTILNDSAICVNGMNKLLHKYDYPSISHKTYETHFDFPVSKYYQNIGWDFNKHPFEKIGIEFMDFYQKDIAQAGLQPGVRKTFKLFSESGKKQFLISAMEHELLLKLTGAYQLHNVFESINGIEDHYGGGKEHVFNKVIEHHNLDKNEILMIGDTLHDAEIADNLGIDCLLLFSGHQSEKRIKTAGKPVIHSYRELNTSLRKILS